MIHVLFTGGTISMRHDAAEGGNLPRHGGAELLALAGVPEGLEYTVEDWARAPACRLDNDRLGALRDRVLELTPEGIHQYGGGYTEYVARTGQEAPGLRS